MKLVRLLVAVLFWLPVPAAAAEWWWFGTYGDGDDRFNAYIDNESAHSDGKRFVTAWVFTNRATPFDNGELSARGFTTIDCQTRTYATASRTAYDAEHQDMGTADLTSSGPQSVEAGSMAEILTRLRAGRLGP